jgi:hypothetical protein
MRTDAGRAPVSGFLPSYGLTGSYRDSDGWLWEVATAQSTCLVSRATGHLPHQDFTCPVCALINQELTRASCW